MWALIYQPLLFFCIAVGAKPAGSRPVKVMHPIHVSTANISFNKQDNKLEIICTIFTDDFEAALAKQYNKKTDLSKAGMHAAMDILVKNYMREHLEIKVSPESLLLNYIGFEINKEATDVYLESDAITPIKKIEVDDSMLYNLFDDQMNIVHITVSGIRKSEKVNYPDRKITQIFE